MTAPRIKFRWEWSLPEKDAVWRALHDSHHRHLAAGNPLAQVSHPAIAYERIISGEQDCLLANGYLVVFDVGPLWSGDVPVVNELYVLATELVHGTLTAAVKALEAVALARGAAGVYVGNASGDDRLDRFYTRQGFKPAGRQFYKEVSNGQSSLEGGQRHQ